MKTRMLAVVAATVLYSTPALCECFVDDDDGNYVCTEENTSREEVDEDALQERIDQAVEDALEQREADAERARKCKAYKRSLTTLMTWKPGTLLQYVPRPPGCT